ncbi:GNAT family N-acetyltransferase [Marinobacter sp.]|uniref:GNAT family N-acetyltransferase n=1 Tax=Marinobacter sp. TaxID=50741 RepID=UPI0034A47A2C
MELRVIRNQDGFGEIQPQWDGLLNKLDPVPLPLSCAWLQSWLGAFAGNAQMEFRCLYSQGHLVGLAPLLKSRERYRGMPVTLLHLAANGHSPYSSVVVDPDLDPAQTREALERLTKVDPNEIGLFFKIPRRSSLKAFLLDQSGIGHESVGEKPSLVTPVINIEGDWETFYRGRPRKLKKSLNHKLNRYHAAEGFDIALETVSTAQQSLVDELIDISSKSWKSAIGNDLKSNHRSRRFLLNLISEFGASGQLTAWIMRQSGVPVAYELHLAHDEIVYPIRADFNAAFKSYSPGSVLEYTALKFLFDNRGARQYYTCADDYWYLSNWTSDYREFCNVEIFGSCTRLKCLYWLEYRVIPVVKRLIGKQPRKQPH